MAVIANVQKEENKAKKLSEFLQAFISGMARVIWYLASPCIPASPQQI